MNYTEYRTHLQTQISTLSYSKQLEFAVLICEKLCPNYRQFSDYYGWGDPDVFEDTVKTLKNEIIKPNDTDLLKSLLPKIDKIAPHMDDFGSDLGSYALNASGAVYETLEFILDRQSFHIANIATYYTDTVDFQIQEETDLTESEIDNNETMIAAWNFVITHTSNGT